MLSGKSVDRLHHANSVMTSCTFVQQGGLASRGYVADRGLPQTPQYTDAIDKKYQIWYDVFTDTVDIHHRARRRNLYGPVLFVLPVTVLQNLPAESRVYVTKKNPCHWRDGEPDGDRFFMTLDDLETGLTKGEFGQMIVITTESGILPFPAGPVSILLDDPQRTLSDRKDAFAWAKKRLAVTSETGGTETAIEMRECRPGCACVNQYGALPEFDTWFR